MRLFLPELHLDSQPRAKAVASRPRSGYQGPRRRILVVDNEEVDRGLLFDALQPLGFEVLQATSGEACLALLTELHTQGDSALA